MLQNASIRQKLYIGFGALILLLIGSGIMGITELRSLFNSANMLVDEDLPLLSTVKEINTSPQKAIYGLRKFSPVMKVNLFKKCSVIGNNLRIIATK